MGTAWDVVNGFAVLFFIGWRVGAIEVDNWNFSIDSIFDSNTPPPEEIVLDGYEYNRDMGGGAEGPGSERETIGYPVQIDRR